MDGFWGEDGVNDTDKGGHRMNGWKGDVTSDGSFRAQQKPPQRNLKPQLT